MSGIPSRLVEGERERCRVSLNVSKDVIKGAISATEEAGTGLILSTKSVAKGMIMGVGDVGGDVVTVTGQTVKGAVKGAQR